jgi:hypothetical protein
MLSIYYETCQCLNISGFYLMSINPTNEFCEVYVDVAYKFQSIWWYEMNNKMQELKLEDV